MHTREYAAASLAELAEELDRLTRLSASAETLSAAYDHTARAVRDLVSEEFRPWVESELAQVRASYGIDQSGPLQAGIEAVSEFLSELAPEPAPDAGGEAAEPAP